MTLTTVIEKLNLEILTSCSTEKDVEGCYIGDLLSWVMGKAGEHNLWITIMTNVNILAVATLTEVACVLIAEGAAVDDAIIQKANEQNVVILRTEDTAYHTAVEFSKLC